MEHHAGASGSPIGLHHGICYQVNLINILNVLRILILYMYITRAHTHTHTHTHISDVIHKWKEKASIKHDSLYLILRANKPFSTIHTLL